MSESVRLRQRGNKYYKSATPQFSPVVQKTRLGQARQLYVDALECSTSAKEKASASKNLAMASWKLASLGKDKKAQILFFFKDAMKYFGGALESRSDTHSDHGWADNLIQNMYKCLQESLDFVNERNMSDERFELLSAACHLFPVGELKADISIYYVKQLLRKSINLFNDNEYARSKNILYDCYRPLEVARRYGTNNKDIMTDVKVYSEDVTMQIAVAEAKQALKTADDLKEKLLMTEEDLNIDMVWEVIDWYKKAILLTRGLDVETEAIAASRIGMVYHSILKLNYKAREYFKNTITLAHSLHPRVLTQEGWYKMSAQTLEAYQVQTVAEETRAWMKDREDTLKKLSTQIDKFKDIEDNYEFMKYVYKNHPPKNEKHKLPDDLPEPSKIERKQIKKLLQKAIIHYHPDNNSKDEYDKEWHVLCEEISKVLTHRYNCMKDVAD